MRYASTAIVICLASPIANAQGSDFLDVSPAPSESRGETYEDGCRDGTFDWRATSDNQFLTIRYFDFETRAGIQTPSGSQQAEKKCNLIGRLRIPGGWKAGIESLEISAHAFTTDRDSVGNIETLYATEDAQRPATLIGTYFGGPYNNNINVSGSLTSDRILYTRCTPFDSEQRLYIDSTLRTQTRGFGESSVTNHTAQRAIVHNFRFVWTRCNSNPPPPPPGWVGSCRVLLETIWGQDMQDYFGNGTGWNEQEAIRNARNHGQALCERARDNNNLYRCVTDNNRCFARQHLEARSEFGAEEQL